MKTITLMPAGFTGPKAEENAKRADKAMEDQRKADSDYRNLMEEIIGVCGGEFGFINYLKTAGNMDKEEAKEFIDSLKEIRARKSAADEELLRSIAGAPPLVKP